MSRDPRASFRSLLAPGWGLVLPLIGGFTPLPAQEPDPVIVHEWGTFTCLQDETGKAIGGINVDDEPVPFFVGGIANQTAAAQYSKDRGNFGLPPYNEQKGWVACDPAVTMRLETPVIYFYPPAGKPAAAVPPLDVHVEFHGGVLSQFFPYATTDGLALNGDTPYMRNPLTAATSTGLTWKQVHLGSVGQPVQTDDKVWTTPREVGASMLDVPLPPPPPNSGPANAWPKNLTERFLFYRGIGQLDSPLYLNRDAYNVGSTDQFFIWSQRTASPSDGRERISRNSVYAQGWLTEIRPDGTCAFRTIRSFGGLMTEGRTRPRAEIDSGFAPADYNAANLARLEASMHDALVRRAFIPTKLPPC
jgi:hypothetical protein